MSGRTGTCPNCSAPLIFRWSGAVQTVCGSCRSVVVRHDVDVTAIGETSDLPLDSSPIQIGTRGTFEGRAFTVIGRIAYEHEEGAWNEWHLLFADQTSGWLSDAQAEYAVSLQVAPVRPAPPIERLKIGEGYDLEERHFEITTITRARYRGVDGELPFEYWGKDEIVFADLRASGGRFATLDYSEASPLVFAGRFISYDELALDNVRRPEDVAAVANTRGSNCRNCGAAIELRALTHTRTVACTSCGAILDPADPNVRILQTASERERIVPLVPLGSRGTWHGHPFDVVGFQERSIEVDGTRYAWREYVLFNFHRGYRYLSEYQGHWNDIGTVRDLVEVDRSRARARVEHGGHTFMHFQHAVARTDFVLGEFPWRVRVGDSMEVDDYVYEQQLLSSEKTGDEHAWSLGTYTDGRTLWQAFGVAGDPPPPAGVFANQPNPYSTRAAGMFAAFLLLASVLAVLLAGRYLTAAREPIFDQAYTYAPATPGPMPGQVEPAFVTDPFPLSREGNIEIRLTSSVSNAWMGWDLALINVDSGAAYNVTREVEFYSGTDSDGAWSEGSRDTRLVLPRLAAGQYYLRFEPESDSRVPVRYAIHLRRDVPTLLPYAVAFGLLLVPPAFVFIRTMSFEHARMQESDYAAGDSGDDEDDEDD